MLSIINSGRVELLDNRRCIAQLIGLERRSSALGKDTVTHSPGGHDDVINSVSGAVVRVLGGKQPMVISKEAVALASRPIPWRSTDPYPGHMHVFIPDAPRRGH
jgi:hypothetical protein